MWWSQPEAQPGVPGVVGRDEAAFVSQSVPLSLTSGSSAPVTITMRNTGGTIWSAAGGYRLSPIDNPWSIGPVPVPQDVGTQQTVTFSFTVTAPETAGAATFSWRMINGAGVAFGESTEPSSITATLPGEPGDCAGLRARIAAIGAEIEQIEELMTGDPQQDAPRQRRITALTLERDNATRTAATLGCTL
jgi:hypothetical protein